ncbi:unnamed protein product [Rotaria sp. Silwood2]|nr:unnamed protein product [Rotaria sp. Silwood2]
MQFQTTTAAKRFCIINVPKGETSRLWLTDLNTSSALKTCAKDYDNRGCGRSSAPWTLEYTTIQMAEDALELIDHLRWSQCHVVGVSMGGMIALELALLAPRRILSLTLMATHAGGLVGQAPLIGLRHIMKTFTIRDEDQLVNNALAMLYGPKTLSDPDKRQYFYDYHRERFKTRVPLSQVGMFGQMFAVQRHYISYADLLKIRYSNFPCLIMVGTEDRLVRETNSYMLQRTLGCRLVKLEHAGHDLGGECAQQVNEELLDPRWDRGQETSGKDPFLTSEYVYALVQGLQRVEDEHYLKITADCKAYNAYDLENWIGTDRFHFNAKISDQDLIETCIHDAHVASIMCSYNTINGIPKDTVAVALHTGTDLNCSDFYLKHTKDALDNKTIVEKDTDRALEHTFNVLIRLGWFDPSEQPFYRQLTKADVDTPESRKLSLESAQ